MIALVQRKRRKAHIASIKPGQAEFVTICDLYVKAAGAEFWQLADAIHLTDADPDRVCQSCYRIVLMAGVIATAHAERRNLHENRGAIRAN